jgi:hypothetical protein
MHSNARFIRLTVACFVGASLTSLSMGQTKRAAVPQNVVLVELFTSEGCSSCPPADALLRKVNGTRTGAGQLIVGISEHVTYWNQLGWTDTFSSPAYTDRQERYANRFALDSVYTPQIVVNGEQEFVGGNEALLGRALASQVEQRKIDLRILGHEVLGSTIKIHFTAEHLPPGKKLDIMAVLTEDAAVSRVLRGENSGRLLQHVAVARSLTKVATVHESADMMVEIPLRPLDSLKKDDAYHLVLFAQEPEQGVVVGADVTAVSLFLRIEKACILSAVFVSNEQRNI